MVNGIGKLLIAAIASAILTAGCGHQNQPCAPDSRNSSVPDHPPEHEAPPRQPSN